MARFLNLSLTFQIKCATIHLICFVLLLPQSPPQAVQMSLGEQVKVDDLNPKDMLVL